MNNGQVIVGIDYLESLIAELYYRRGIMSALANILEVTPVPDKNIIKILRSVER